MSATSPASTPPVLALTTEYSTPYAALVRDEIVMGVPRYFLERWLPVLGPAPAALVNTLRQLDYRCQDEVITISGEALAKEASMSRRHLYTCLEHPWIGAFVRTLSGQRARDAEGKIWQQANRYAVRMDDPLTPGDAEHLRQTLVTLADNPFQAAARAMALEPRALWAAQPGADSSASAPPSFSPPAAITARDALLRAFPDWRFSHPEEERAFNQLAEGLHRHITLGRDDGRTSKIIVPQYFRRRWWARLGHDLAWAYLWLRGNLYDRPDEGIRRNTCWVPALDTLLTLLGRPREWWRRNVEQARPHPDGWSLADFFAQIDSRKGRDPERPQWVARRFRVALDIPIAPEDRAAYAALLRDWPASGLPPGPALAGSESSAHTGPAEVRHIETHRSSQGPPHSDTPGDPGSATSEHTGEQGVRHIPTQGSATAAHSQELEPFPPASEVPSAPEDSPSKQPPAAEPPAAAAAAPENGAGQGARLPVRLRRAFEQAPDTPLCDAAPVRAWLEQAWVEPVRPHTPAWTLADRGAIAPGDLVALMLAAQADPTVQEPPRYLSWLAQRLVAEPGTPPVERWAEWRRLASLPLSAWDGEGRETWRTLAPRDRRALPFGLDDVLPEPEPPAPPEPIPVTAPAPPVTPSADGLDERPGGGLLSVADMWRATLGQLSLQLNRATYQSWVEGAQAVGYAEGVLAVQTRSAASREWLATRLAPVIERALASMAGQPVRVEYTVKEPGSPRV
ncbi:MAG TPA: DnaA N-terminal domain-containing protein [Aggregatilineaceae bacterium]|nr:DnaA N-terminal domain-containing protein [Aggregatilineaceae bacterium]